MINLDFSERRRGTDFGRAFARFTLAVTIALGDAAFAAGDGTIAAAVKYAVSENA